MNYLRNMFRRAGSTFGGKNLIKGLILSIFASVFAFAITGTAQAATPYLTANYLSSGSGSVQITVTNANSYSQINLSTRQSSTLWTEIKNIGQTDGSGYFTQVINLPSDGTSSQVQMYVTVSNLQSPTVSVSPYGSSGGCTYNCGSPYGISLSQSSVSLTQGQSSSVSIYNGSGYYGSYYIASNSNAYVASASVSGNTINLNALNVGSSTISICQNSSSGNCVSLYITVTGSSGCSYYGCSGNLSLSQSNLNLNSGQSSTINIYNNTGYSGNYYISSNSNPNNVSAYISGSTVSVSGISSGSSIINICQSGSSACVSLTVVVSGGGCSYNCSGSLSLSQTNVTLNYGQSTTVTAYNYSGGSLYISSNSNSGVVSASVSGSTINLYANSNGIATVVVCANNISQCASIYVTVNGSGSASGNVWFSPSNPSLTFGQSLAVSINSSVVAQTYPYYSNAYYVSSNSDSNIVSASVSGTALNLYALRIGTASIVVCHSSLSICGTVYVTVSGNNSGTGLSLSQYNVSVNQGQTLPVIIYGGGSYYISSNTNSNVATAVVNGNTVNVYGNQNGSTTFAICQSGYSGCINLYVTVSGYSYNGGGLQYPGGNVLGSSAYPNGQLISENGTVYIVYKNTKTGFASANVFTALGYSFNNVLQVGYSNLASTGYAVSNAYSSHPWGSWIKSGATVYFVHESGLIPVPNWDTFLNNGGQANFIVLANSADFRLPMLTPMTYSDSRVR